jgi:septum site-determining protein MinC
MVTTTRSNPGAAPFELKGSLFTLTVLHLRQTDLAVIDHHLAAKIGQAPGFFQNVPVIIDLELVAPETAIDFHGLCELLCQRGMIPVAIRNGSPEQQQKAAAARLPTLPSKPIEAPEPRVNPLKKSSTVHPPPAQRLHYRLHAQPVRSGQRVYAPEGDLILLAPVNHGAEVLADGNIHVYAPMRGRALAGVKGDARARIFCQNLEAELVAVAGHYRVIEQKDTQIWGHSVQIYLTEDERLIIEPLSR